MARAPTFVRGLTHDEQAALTAGLRSHGAFVLRRCQILLASASGKRAYQIAAELGCDTDTALNAIDAFNCTGEEGVTPERVSRETVRTALQRLGVRRKRARQWITSPDPAYA
jgi:hypothetical protein